MNAVGETSQFVIHVYCDDTSTRSGMHNGKDVKVVAFQHIDGQWVVLRHERLATRDAHENARQEYWDRIRASGETYDETEYHGHMVAALGEGFDVPEQLDGRDANGDRARFDDRFAHTTYKLRCSLCGRDFQRRHEAVAPSLDRLHAAGMSRISLSQLAAIVGE